MTRAIRTVNLTKRFKRSPGVWKRLRGVQGPPDVSAVDGVSIAVEEGEVFGLLGVNGAGKTTLIKLLSTLLIPTSGEGWIFDRSIVEQPHDVRKLIGLVSADERSFYWRLTGRQNLNFVAGVYNLSRKEGRERIEELAASLKIAPYLDEPVTTYSTGMRQKLAIIRGLLTRPRVLFMDEPTKGLDPIAATEFVDLIGREVITRFRVAVLITTHILREAELLCDRVAIMQSGRIVVCDSPARLQQGFSGVETYVLKVAGFTAAHRRQLSALDGVVACNTGAMVDGCVDVELHVHKGGDVLSAALAVLITERGTILGCDRRIVPFERIFSTIVQEGGPASGSPS